MRCWFRSAIVCTFASLCAPGAIAQESDDIARLKEALEAQQALNQRLLERLEALEGAQAATVEKIQAMARSIPAEETIREQCEAMFEEFREDYFDLGKGGIGYLYEHEGSGSVRVSEVENR